MTKQTKFPIGTRVYFKELDANTCFGTVINTPETSEYYDAEDIIWADWEHRGSAEPTPGWVEIKEVFKAEVEQTAQPPKVPHKHAELIKAWADGAIIQYLSLIDSTWQDVIDNDPAWSIHTKYRIKPNPKWYRVAIFSNGVVGVISSENWQNENAVEVDALFDRWLTDRVYYEV